MDASQLWYREIVHSGPKHKFCIFLRAEINEMLWNTPNHHVGSNGAEWILRKFSTPKYWIQSRNTSFSSFYVSKVRKMLWNTPKHHFGSNGVEWMLRKFGTPK
jgi:hypothetical protein